MNTITSQAEEKRYQKSLTFIRLALLLIQLLIILNNRGDETANILKFFPEIQRSELSEFKYVQRNFNAANTMALVFVVMQLIILYVGTNRFRVKHTIFIVVMHIIGNYIYMSRSRWQFQHVWTIFHLFSFFPLVSEITVALYTAKT